MEWCCSAFEDRYYSAATRGIGILVGRNSIGNPEFILQHRAVDKEVIFNLDTEFPISIVTEDHFNYCFWCGRNLDEWYGAYVDDLYRPGLKISDGTAAMEKAKRLT